MSVVTDRLAELEQRVAALERYAQVDLPSPNPDRLNAYHDELARGIVDDIIRRKPQWALDGYARIETWDAFGRRHVRHVPTKVVDHLLLAMRAAEEAAKK